ncbi:hypothetical protein BDQ94DRAFT_138141 [Aspergillus welwitschiae]|uniref:Uncharacterized protein n=1 Tax=Aspergillus welwitschiae TaxID=1341132 RepID=A0A3F3QBM2_9EURO|nr:hypothetical protein BDQ94DRAFT_138141 [Aspergillus welwitschiae]RDH36613.1 hypothetical protein BDQ94DRAFT_138141 [Aspergillus welwitschiae]
MDHLQDSSRTRIIPPSDRVWVGVPAHTYAHTVTVVTCRYRRVREGKEERRFHARLPPPCDITTGSLQSTRSQAGRSGKASWEHCSPHGGGQEGRGEGDSIILPPIHRI